MDKAETGTASTSGMFVVGAYGLAAALFVGGVIAKHLGYNYYEETTKAAEMLVLGSGLFSVFLVRNQLIAQEKQLQANFQQQMDDHRWKTFVSYHELFADGIPCESMREKMYGFAKSHGFIEAFDDMGTCMPEKALQQCIADSDSRQIVRPYLDEFEKFCGAINSQIVNEEYARSLQGTRVIRNYAVFEPLIKHFQKGNPMAYVELEKVAMKWSMQRRVEEQAARQGMGVGTGTNTVINGPKGVRITG
jgi:hypothetical protein